MKDTISKRVRRIYSLIALIAATIIWSGCSKEELTVRDITIDELESSFYVLAEGTIELDRNQYDNLIIQKNNEELIVKNEGVFENIEVGTNILTSPSLPLDDLIWRKVIGVQKSGENLILQTENANILEAFTEFYFDSDLPLISVPRNSETLDDVPPEEVNQMFSNIGQEPTFKLSPVFEISGSPKFKAIHPHRRSI